MTGTILTVHGWEVLDSRGHPTVGCLVRLDDGSEGVGLVPTGASTGRHEVADRRDGGRRYCGLGTRRAVDELNQRWSPALAGRPADEVDPLLEGPSNVTLAISLAAARAAAASTGVDMWRWAAMQAGTEDPGIPCPMVNVFSGGRHADGAVAFQDYLAIPVGATTFAEAIEMVWDVREEARARLGRVDGHRSMAGMVADEGGLALVSTDVEAPLALLADAIESTGHDVAVGLDVAATQVDGLESVVELLTRWCERYPIVSIEDPLGDDDLDGWADAAGDLRGVQLVADDLIATDAARIRLVASRAAANTALIKPNQVGTLSRALEAVSTAREVDWRTVMSARSGDTEDDAIADLAVGWDTGQIKVGSLTRSERLSKYNRLLRLEAVEKLPYRPWRSM